MDPLNFLFMITVPGSQEEFELEQNFHGPNETTNTLQLDEATLNEINDLTEEKAKILKRLSTLKEDDGEQPLGQTQADIEVSIDQQTTETKPKKPNSTIEIKEISDLQAEENQNSVNSAMSMESEVELKRESPYAKVKDFIKHLNIHCSKCLAFQEPSGPQFLFMFTIHKSLVEKYFNRLCTLGIGQSKESGNIQVLPLSMSIEGDPNVPQTSQTDENETSKDGDTKKTVFQDTIKARIAVSHLTALVHDSAQFTFDYVMLVIVASILALIGLATNNQVVIVASMLVSPLMGPILAVTFGAVVADYELSKLGLVSELYGLLMCVLVGFVGGLLVTPMAAGEFEWPTAEMASRGNVQGLVVGIFVAIPSGIGVALSILGNNTSSLVGVAISASLLPPAVNSGLLLSYAALVNALDDNMNPTNKTVGELSAASGLSLTLCVLNILIVWVAGIGMFRLKEVTRLPSSDTFWKEDVALARKFNTVARNSPEGKEMKAKLMKALKKAKRSNSSYELGLQENRLSVSNTDFFKPPQQSTVPISSIWNR